MLRERSPVLSGCAARQRRGAPARDCEPLLPTQREPVMASPHWLFGPFRLDPDNACLWHGGQARPLTPKAFDVLHFLLMHPDRLITKDEFFDALWPGVVVSEAALRVCIAELRKALGD